MPYAIVQAMVTPIVHLRTDRVLSSRRALSRGRTASADKRQPAHETNLNAADKTEYRVSTGVYHDVGLSTRAHQGPRFRVFDMNDDREPLGVSQPPLALGDRLQ